MTAAGEPGTAVALRDDSRVVVRPVGPDDRELLLAGTDPVTGDGVGVAR